MHEIQTRQCSEEYSTEIDNLVKRYKDSTGPLMKLANVRIGSVFNDSIDNEYSGCTTAKNLTQCRTRY